MPCTGICLFNPPDAFQINEYNSPVATRLPQVRHLQFWEEFVCCSNMNKLYPLASLEGFKTCSAFVFRVILYQQRHVSWEPVPPGQVLQLLRNLHHRRGHKSLDRTYLILYVGYLFLYDVSHVPWPLCEIGLTTVRVCLVHGVWDTSGWILHPVDTFWLEGCYGRMFRWSANSASGTGSQSKWLIHTLCFSGCPSSNDLLQ